MTQIVKHKDGVFLPSHPEISPHYLQGSLKAFCDALDQFATGTGQHPESKHLEAIAPHLEQVWLAVLEMVDYPAPAEKVTL